MRMYFTLHAKASAVVPVLTRVTQKGSCACNKRARVTLLQRQQQQGSNLKPFLNLPSLCFFPLLSSIASCPITTPFPKTPFLRRLHYRLDDNKRGEGWTGGEWNRYRKKVPPHSGTIITSIVCECDCVCAKDKIDGIFLSICITFIRFNSLKLWKTIWKCEW